MKTKFQIGHEFTTRGKSPNRCVIVDVWQTYNSAGDLVKLRYVATHTFMGQTVTSYDVCETTVAVGTKP